MNSDSNWKTMWLVLPATIICSALAVGTSAQVQTTTSGAPTKKMRIESGEVVAVKGNNLFVKMTDGTLRDFPNVPESARAEVDGKQLGIHELKPGMKLIRITATTTTPQVVTTVVTVTGKVFEVTPPLFVVLTLENGQNQKFNIPEGQKFTVDGQETDAFGLKQGMVVTATRITEVPVTSVSQHSHVVGKLPADTPVLIDAK